MKKKIFLGRIVFWLLPNYIVKKKNCIIRLNCIAAQGKKKNLYCEIELQGRLKVKEVVLQYSHCIAEKKA